MSNGVVLMPGQIDSVSNLLGRLEASVENLDKAVSRQAKQLETMEEVVSAMSAANRIIAQRLDDVAPLAFDYRDRKNKVLGGAAVIVFIYSTLVVLIAEYVKSLFGLGKH